MSENKRFGELIKKLGFKNQTKFAEALGLKQGSVSGIIGEKKGAVVSSNTKNRLEKDFNVNIEWLSTGKGEWQKANNKTVDDTKDKSLYEEIIRLLKKENQKLEKENHRLQEELDQLNGKTKQASNF